MKRTLTAIALIGTFTLAVPAAAQWIVNDPINLIQNFASATAGISNEINSARALIEQIRSAKELVKSTASIHGLAQLAGLDKELSLYRDLIAIDTQLKKTVDASQRLGLDIKAQFGASDFSWKKFNDEQRRLDESTRKAAREQYDMLVRSMTENSGRRKQVISEMQNAPGPTHAIQALGASLDIIIGQNQQMLAALAHQQLAEEYARDGANNSDAGVQSKLQNYQRRLREAARAY
jgi:hypothetical protein